MVRLVVGSSRALLAALSTFSFPGMPVCPGGQIKVMGMWSRLSVVRSVWIRVLRGWEESFEYSEEWVSRVCPCSFFVL